MTRPDNQKYMKETLEKVSIVLSVIFFSPDSFGTFRPQSHKAKRNGKGKEPNFSAHKTTN